MICTEWRGNSHWSCAERQVRRCLIPTAESDQPIGRRAVERAIESFEGGRTLLEALGMHAVQSANERHGAFAGPMAPGAEGEARRQRWREAIEKRNYVCNTLGMELNQTCQSAACWCGWICT